WGLAGCAGAGDDLAGATSLDQEAQDVALGPPHAIGKLVVDGETLQARSSLEIDDRRDSGAGCRRLFGMSDVEAQRAAVRAELVGVDHGQRVGREDPARRPQREVRKMLVVDLVELIALERAEQVRKLD